MNWGTMSLIEVLWTGMALIGYGAALAGLLTAQRDLRSTRTAPAPSARDRARRVLVARASRRREAVSTFLQATFTLVGLRALGLPPNPGSSDLGTQATGLLLFTAAALLTWCSVRDRADRRRFDRDLR